MRVLVVVAAVRDHQGWAQALLEQQEAAAAVLTGQAPLREVLVGAAVAVLNGTLSMARVVAVVAALATSRVVQGAVTAAAQEAASTRT